MKRYAIVGFGCGGYHAAKSLREESPACRIDVYSDTADAPANPMLTTYYAAGKIDREAMFPFGGKEKIVQELGLHLHGNTAVTKLLPDRRALVLADGSQEEFDDIVIATGAHAVVPPIPGMPTRGVYVMRTPEDADSFLAAMEGGLSSALVIGASWVGIKVVEAMYAHQIPAILADMAPYIFPTAAFSETAERIHARLRALGTELIFGKGIKSFEETGDGIISTFTDGSSVKTSAVVLCMGVAPSISFVEKGTLEVGRGIRVDRHMRTSAPHIYAVGDCCEAMEITSGNYMCVSLWANAVTQGQIAARNILGGDDAFSGSLVHNITHFLDMDFIGIGDPKATGQVMEFDGGGDGIYIRLVKADGMLRCINILGKYRIGGSLKSWFLRQREQPEEPMPTTLRVNLLREGMSEEFISLIEESGK